MMDFIAKYWLEVVFGAILAGFGAAFRGLSRRVSKRIEEQEAIKLGMPTTITWTRAFAPFTPGRM